MGRLTIRTENGAALKLDNPQNETEARKQLHDKYLIAIEKLAHYEDMEEAGRLYVLECGIEKPLYALMPQLDWKDGHLKAKWRISIVVPRDVEECLLWEDDMKRGMAFLTKEEAEAKLKELEDGKKENNKG